MAKYIKILGTGFAPVCKVRCHFRVAGMKGRHYAARANVTIPIRAEISLQEEDYCLFCRQSIELEAVSVLLYNQ